MNTRYYTGLFRVLCLSGISVILFSCNKDKKEECSLSPASIAGTYRLKSITYKMTGTSPELDYMLLLDPCERDDVFIINADGSYRRSDAGIVCIPDAGSTGTWSMQDNLLISDGFISGLIEQFNCKSLVISSTDNGVPGDKTTITLEKQ